MVVRRRDGTLVSWGGNARGELLDPAAATRAAPAPVPGLTGVDELSTGLGRGLCVRIGERAQCWNADARRFEAVQGLP